MTEKKDKAAAHGAPRDSSMKVKIHPPSHFLASGLATLVLGGFKVGGTRMQIVTAPSPRKKEWTMMITCLGMASFAGAVALSRSAMLTFQKNKTPIPHGYKVQTIVSDGVYGYTRNPIYVAMVGGVASIGIAMNTWWGGISALYLMGAMHRLVIPYEEQYLQTNFGQAYVDYRAKVPRWFMSL